MEHALQQKREEVALLARSSSGPTPMPIRDSDKIIKGREVVALHSSEDNFMPPHYQDEDDLQAIYDVDGAIRMY